MVSVVLCYILAGYFAVDCISIVYEAMILDECGR